MVYGTYNCIIYIYSNNNSNIWFIEYYGLLTIYNSNNYGLWYL